MMLKMMLLMLINISMLSTAYAKIALDGLIITGDKAPSELKLLVQHLQQKIKDQDKIHEVLNYARIINKDLGTQKRTHTLLLIKSEIYRNFIKGVYLEQKPDSGVNSTLIESVKTKYQKKEYSPLTKWFINSILADLQFYNEKDILDNKDKISRFNAQDNLLAMELDKKLKFLAPWIITFDKIPADSFEKIVTETAQSCLKSIATKSFYFGTFSNIYNKEKEEQIFKLPEIKLNKKATESNAEADGPLAISQKKKQEAQNVVKKINPDDLSQASQEIDKIDQTDKSDKKEKWTPK